MFKPYTRAQVEFNRLQEIGPEGKNSTTHLCHDPQLGADIVVKKIEKSNLDEDIYFSESQALYKSAHPNVVSVLYACQDEDNIYIAMPHYSGGSLKKKIQDSFLSVREIITISCQVLSGLHNIHSKGLIHFDVKLDNILLNNRGEASISDFGLAKAVEAGGLAQQDKFYFKNKPPESLGGGYEFGITFDIYQFGLSLYRMCVGDDLFYSQFNSYFDEGGNFDRNGFKVAVRNGQFPDRRAFPAHIPEKLRRACKKCLEPDPSERFLSAIAVSNELAQIDDAYLDWKYTKEPDCQTWRKNVNGTEYEFTVATDGTTSMLKAAVGGEPRRVRKYCTNGMTERQIRTALGEKL